METKTKKCKHCQKEKPVTEFGRHKTSWDGLQPWCRECSNDYTALAEKWKDIGGARCCRVCREIKPKNGDYFTPSTSFKGGFKTVCRECERRQEEGAGTAQECGQSVTEPSGVREAGTDGELRRSVIVRI